eukprot:6214697-Pleurochrysis_carterae.AAC.2
MGPRAAVLRWQTWPLRGYSVAASSPPDAEWCADRNPRGARRWRFPRRSRAAASLPCVPTARHPVNCAQREARLKGETHGARMQRRDGRVRQQTGSRPWPKAHSVGANERPRSRGGFRPPDSRATRQMLCQPGLSSMLLRGKARRMGDTKQRSHCLRSLR